MLAPKDITSKRFGKAAFGGYKVEEVHTFLAELAEAYASEVNARVELENHVNALRTELSQFHEQEGSLSTVLLGAQKMADNIIKEAKGRSDLIVRDAEIKADRMLEGTERQLEMEKNEYDNLRKEVSAFRANILSLYKTHLELVSALPSPDQDVSGRFQMNTDSKNLASSDALTQASAPPDREEGGAASPSKEGVSAEKEEEAPLPEEEPVRRRKGFVPNLEPKTQGQFSFYSNVEEEAEGANLNPQPEQLPPSNMEATNTIDQPVMEANPNYYGDEDQQAQESRFGELRFGERYNLYQNSTGARKKKKRR